MNKYYLFPLFIILACFSPTYMFANPLPDAQVQKLNEELEQVKGENKVYKDMSEEIKNYREYLQKETDKLRDTVQKERESLYSQFNFFITFLGIAMTVAIAVFSYQFMQTRKELMQSIIEETKEKALDYQNRLNQIQTHYEDQLKNKLEELTQQTKEIKALQKAMQHELNLSLSEIYITASIHEIARIKTLEKEHLVKRGIHTDHLHFLSYNLEKIKPLLQTNIVDILVFSCEPDTIDDLFLLIEYLHQEKLEIPLVVYTYQLGKRFDKQELFQINQYPFAVISNAPVTLIGHISQLAQTFSVAK
ncbi:hypothetical protein SAMN05444392_1277 [Seinonella peptonophila]|uniref:Uncharacterized protein n=1 Tax=Seinonella peptonophila TaxID=112248 RepID=A0A1M5BMW8_9BACL|nr:hypothetical protein [Seinonella peptonophila]SHF43745.1 hypothetical protein SAMN05444392_1277 [Seinonella peptonophila]